MLAIYAALAFLFFKIFPEFADLDSNTVIGAIVMALTSAACLWAFELFAAKSALDWSAKSMTNMDASGAAWKTGLILAAGVIASGASTYLVAAGFAQDLFHDAFRGPSRRLRPEMVMFWTMAVIPPACHFLARILSAVSAVRQARRDLKK